MDLLPVSVDYIRKSTPSKTPEAGGLTGFHWGCNILLLTGVIVALSKEYLHLIE